MSEVNKENNGVTPAPDEGKDPEPSQPEKPVRSEKEKAEFTLKMTAKRIKELGGDPQDILGIKPQIKIDENLSDDTPLTVGTFKELQKTEAKKTALQMADELEDEDERKKTKELLEKRIVPSGNAQEDFNLAYSTVNASRTAQIAADQKRVKDAKRSAAGGSSDVRPEEMFEPTPEEQIFMRPPYNLTKEQIIKARQEALEKK